VNIVLSTPLDWREMLPQSNPIADIQSAMERSLGSITLLGFRGPIPVDLTVASAALNRGEAPFRKASR
jgi:hypothetical protein